MWLKWDIQLFSVWSYAVADISNIILRCQHLLSIHVLEAVSNTFTFYSHMYGLRGHKVLFKLMCGIVFHVIFSGVLLHVILAAYFCMLFSPHTFTCYFQAILLDVLFVAHIYLLFSRNTFAYFFSRHAFTYFSRNTFTHFSRVILLHVVFAACVYSYSPSICERIKLLISDTKTTTQN